MKGEFKGKRYRWKPSECIYFFNRHQHDQCLLVSSLNSAKIKGAGTLMMTHGKSRSISYFPFNVSRDCLIFGLWSFAHSNVRRLFLSLSHIRYIEEGILEAKTKCYEKDKVKSLPFFSIVLRRFLVIFSTTTSISFTKLKIRRSFWGAEQV